MAEWSIAAVLKTVELRGSGGSNPSLSAKLGAKWRHIQAKSCKIKHLQDFSFSGNKPRHDKKRRKTTGFCY